MTQRSWQVGVHQSPIRVHANRYRRAARRPLYALLFILPFLLLYEYGAASLRPWEGVGSGLLARNLVQDVLGWVGGGVPGVPAVLLIGALVAQHAASGETWRVRGWVLPMMLAEAWLAAVPLVLFRSILAARTDDTLPLSVIALGAGIYEEMVFRLVLLSALVWAGRDLLGMQRPGAQGVAIGVTALLFAAAHFGPFAFEGFAWPRFLYLALGGAYLGLVYCVRGFGIAAGAHACANLSVVWGAAAGGGV